ncbi:MAG: ribosomal large subunit pseudouridine synthase B [Bacteroidales bacterium]|nr:ribosomal large subunit pseudouridine synthase B [Bacteroidales bacterium]
MKASAQTLAFSVSEINMNFYIKVYGRDRQGRRVNKLLGVSGLIALVGSIEMVNKLLVRAFSCLFDKCVCKLRRGLQISFYAK